ncbi:MAG: cobyrinate a,c-diamide synthase [Coriobacteriales bacterium]|jgi:cobyrinic acid a,c-diamide synthase|nr:cobyrinate a,c-diamide synthase [Coriobacteriales bacterium]
MIEAKARVMIAGTASGSGKTTMSIALLAALLTTGRKVVSFKCGPDYIDPMFHKKTTGVDSRNLDIFLMGEPAVKCSVHRQEANCDIALMEGVMGFYDGQGGGSFASSNHLSLLTGTPVVLAVNTKGAALSVCATIKGFQEFAENNIRAVILNNTSPSSFPLYKQMVEEHTGLPVIGFLPPVPEAHLESRHLGLVTAAEIADIQVKIEALKAAALEHIDIDALLRIAKTAEALGCENDPIIAARAEAEKSGRRVKLYVAEDEAFSFFYRDNHELLEALGAEIATFSPLHDSELPADADALILWGGYPELHAAELASNTSMKASLTKAIASGLPVYAECGGFMYLQESLTDSEGQTHEMLGVLPGQTKMTKGLKNFGYYEIEAREDNMLCKAGGTINAHFFHHSQGDNEGDSFIARKKNGKTLNCIVAQNNIFAGYQHLHFWGNPKFASNFIKATATYQASRNSQRT